MEAEEISGKNIQGEGGIYSTEVSVADEVNLGAIDRKRGSENENVEGSGNNPEMSATPAIIVEEFYDPYNDIISRREEIFTAVMHRFFLSNNCCKFSRGELMRACDKGNWDFDKISSYLLSKPDIIAKDNIWTQVNSEASTTRTYLDVDNSSVKKE